MGQCYFSEPLILGKNLVAIIRRKFNKPLSWLVMLWIHVNNLQVYIPSRFSFSSKMDKTNLYSLKIQTALSTHPLLCPLRDSPFDRQLFINKLHQQVWHSRGLCINLKHINKNLQSLILSMIYYKVEPLVEDINQSVLWPFSLLFQTTVPQNMYSLRKGLSRWAQHLALLITST